MDERYAKVPPAVPLLLEEVIARCDDWDSAFARLKGLLPELQAQSRDQVERALGREAEPAPAGRFDIYLDGGLNIFGSEGACQELDCRLDAANRLSRSVGLLADRVWLTDHISDCFLDVDELTDDDLAAVLDDALVLAELKPLIDAGVVMFASPWIPTCNQCSDSFESTLTGLTGLLKEGFLDDFEVESMRGRAYAVQTGNSYSPPVVLRGTRSRRAKVPTRDQMASRVVYRALRNTMWIARDASLGRGSLFSNSRIGLAGVAAHEGRIKSRAEFRALDESRAVELPWVSQLSVTQVVQLRGEAEKALPIFRELLAARLTHRGVEGDAQGGQEVIDQLRFQAAEVRGELGHVGKKADRYWGSPYALLGLGVSVLGLAMDEPVAAASGLLALLELIRGHREGNEQELAKLQSKPGYVLVKAQDLLAHVGKGPRV